MTPLAASVRLRTECTCCLRRFVSALIVFLCPIARDVATRVCSRSRVGSDRAALVSPYLFAGLLVSVFSRPGILVVLD